LGSSKLITTNSIWNVHRKKETVQSSRELRKKKGAWHSNTAELFLLMENMTAGL